MRRHLLLNGRERDRSPNAPAGRRPADAGQFADRLRRDEQRERLEFLVQLDADLRRPGDQPGGRVLAL